MLIWKWGRGTTEELSPTVYTPTEVTDPWWSWYLSWTPHIVTEASSQISILVYYDWILATSSPVPSCTPSFESMAVLRYLKVARRPVVLIHGKIVSVTSKRGHHVSIRCSLTSWLSLEIWLANGKSLWVRCCEIPWYCAHWSSADLSHCPEGLAFHLSLCEVTRTEVSQVSTVASFSIYLIWFEGRKQRTWNFGDLSS